MKLWEVDTKLCVQEYVGHGDVVRDIKITSSETFLSAANDWSATTENGNIRSTCTPAVISTSGIVLVDITCNPGLDSR